MMPDEILNAFIEVINDEKVTFLIDDTSITVYKKHVQPIRELNYLIEQVLTAGKIKYIKKVENWTKSHKNVPIPGFLVEKLNLFDMTVYGSVKLRGCMYDR